MSQKPGRPSKLPAVDLGQVRAMAGLGLTEEEIALVLNVAPRTFAYWKVKSPEFLQALKSGKVKADAQVAKSLYEMAIGEAPRPAVKDEAGRIIKPAASGREPNVTAAIFWLKNRQRDRWRDRQEIDAPGVEKALYELSEKFLPAVVRDGAKNPGRGHVPK